MCFLLRNLMFLVAVVTATFDTDPDWMVFKEQHNKEYRDGGEEEFRYSVWKDNVRMIANHNAGFERGEHSYWLGMNHFGDMTHDEFLSATAISIKPGKPADWTLMAPRGVEDLPKEVDWVARGYNTSVFNQGMCGSCWAFSANGALAAQHWRKTGDLVILSAQNLMDCSHKQGNYGCSGGLIDASFEYIKVNNGVDTEKAYPYEAKDGKCRFTRAGVGATDTGYVDIQRGSEAALQKAVAEVGPIAIAMDSLAPGFSFYKGGVYSSPQCDPHRLAHTLLTTGYGVYNGKEFWMNKNSFGVDWGINGYMMIARNENNMCGIASLASYPTV